MRSARTTTAPAPAIEPTGKSNGVKNERKSSPGGARLPKAVGVYDRPRVRRSSRLLILLGIVVVVIAFVLMILLR